VSVLRKLIAWLAALGIGLAGGYLASKAWTEAA
jgi:hypothetical protein